MKLLSFNYWVGKEFVFLFKMFQESLMKDFLMRSQFLGIVKKDFDENLDNKMKKNSN